MVYAGTSARRSHVLTSIRLMPARLRSRDHDINESGAGLEKRALVQGMAACAAVSHLFTVSSKEPIEHQRGRFNSSLSRIDRQIGALRRCGADRLVETQQPWVIESIIEALSGRTGVCACMKTGAGHARYGMRLTVICDAAFRILTDNSCKANWLCIHTFFSDYLHGPRLKPFNIRLF